MTQATDDLKTRLAAVLADDGPVAALTALRLAADWSARALGTAPDDDVSAFRAVAELDDALDRITELERGVPALVQAAAPGAPVRDHLRERHAALAAARADLAADRAVLAELGQVRDELAGLADEHERLRDRVAELRRLRRLADEVDDLRAQRDALETRQAALAESAAAERAVGDAADGVVRLTREQLELLRPRVRDALREAADTTAELAGLRERLDDAEGTTERERARLAEAERGFERLSDLRDRVRGPLRAYLRADRALAAGLAAASGGPPSLIKESGLDRADRDLADLEDRLDAIDAALGRALDEHARAQEGARAVLGWTG
ncbi:hypothetical protein [Actinomadura rifamycini]|uniref:hypothetical protein n=1 Tax=Actinomadura rifamycini TaxID=31962 RepID=UPI00041A72A5|nr:hypothetical protein [Actinomadura rifamycini]